MGTLKLRRRRTALGAGLATLAMAAGLAAVPAQAVDKTTYVALGDSFAAGQGAGPYKNDICYRSDNTYSELAADTKPIKLVTNAACSGDTTQDVVATQLSKLNMRTELVTITAGGNNLGFGDIVTNCGAAGSAALAACAQATSDAMAQLNGPLFADLVSMIHSVQAAAPNAKIVVTGYPSLFDPVEPTDPMFEFIGQATALANGLNWSIAQAVLAADPEATHVQYVDVRADFAGHGINSGQPWINGAIPDSPDSFHPNAKGYKAYYTALSRDGAYSAR